MIGHCNGARLDVHRVPCHMHVLGLLSWPQVLFKYVWQPS